jgi:hypothetical protein
MPRWRLARGGWRGTEIGFSSDGLQVGPVIAANVCFRPEAMIDKLLIAGIFLQAGTARIEKRRDRG